MGFGQTPLVADQRMSGDNQEGKQATQWDMHRSDVISHWVGSSLCTFLSRATVDTH